MLCTEAREQLAQILPTQSHTLSPPYSISHTQILSFQPHTLKSSLCNLDCQFAALCMQLGCPEARVHACDRLVQTRARTHIRTTHTLAGACMHVTDWCRHVHARTYVQHIHSWVHACIHTQAHTHTNTCKHATTFTRTHAQTRTSTPAHTHTHACSCVRCRSGPLCPHPPRAPTRRPGASATTSCHGT